MSGRIRAAAAKAVEALESRMMLAGGTIAGVLYEDANANGVRDGGEVGIAGRTVYLDIDGDGALSAGDPSASTASDGSYAFMDLPLGDYQIESLPVTGWLTTSPGTLFTVRFGGSGYLAAELNPVTGAATPRFAVPYEAGSWCDTLAFNGSSLFYIPTSESTTLYEIDPTSGSVVDTHAIPASPTGHYYGVAAIGREVYLSTGTGVVFAFDTLTDTLTRTMDVGAINGGNVSLDAAISGMRGPSQLVGWDKAAQQFAVLDANTGILVRRFGAAYPGSNGEPATLFGLAVVNGEVFANWDGTALAVYGEDGTFHRATPLSPFQWSLGGDDAGRTIHLTSDAPSAIDVSFGAVELVEVGGVNFHDQDGDGVRDAGDEGLAGWTVFIDSDRDGTLDPGERSMVTDSGGGYAFGEMLPGEYVIGQVQQAGWKRTTSGLYDIGNQRVGVIGGVKYHDRNNNGTRDAGEEGLAGWTIYADSNGNGALDVGEPSTVTDSGGNYQLVDLPAGDYVVEEVPQSGWVQTYPGVGRLFTVRSSGSTPMLTELNPTTGATIRQVALPGTPGGWSDVLAFNGTSVFYLPGSLSTTLYEVNPDSGTVLNTITLPSGQYYGLAAIGSKVYIANVTDYSVVTVDAKAGTVAGTVNVGAANGNDVGFGWALAALRGTAELVGFDVQHQRFAVIDRTTGMVQRTFGNGYLNEGMPWIPIGLAVTGNEIFAQWTMKNSSFTDVYRLDGTFVRKITTGHQWGLGGDGVSRVVQVSDVLPTVTADFGGVEPGQLSGTKYNDRNGNGARDAGEEGLAGWTVYLDADADSVLDDDEPYALTDSNGDYAIEGVLPGNYVLDEVPQAGWRQTTLPDVLFTVDYSGPWAGTNPGPGFSRINPVTGAKVGWFPLPAGAPGFSAAEQNLAYNGFDLFYAPGSGSAALYRLDPQTGAVRSTFTLPSAYCRGLAAIGNRVYALTGAVTVSVINGTTGVLEKTVTIPGLSSFVGLTALRNPSALATSDASTGSLVELDPQTLAVRSSFAVAPGSSDWIYDLGSANGNIYVPWEHAGNYQTAEVFSRDGNTHWTLPVSFFSL